MLLNIPTIIAFLASTITLVFASPVSKRAIEVHRFAVVECVKGCKPFGYLKADGSLAADIKDAATYSLDTTAGTLSVNGHEIGIPQEPQLPELFASPLPSPSSVEMIFTGFTIDKGGENSGLLWNNKAFSLTKTGHTTFVLAQTAAGSTVYVVATGESLKGLKVVHLIPQ